MRTRTPALLLLVQLASSAGLGAQQRQGETSDDIRARLKVTAAGTELSVTLHTGEMLKGELSDTREDAFGIWVEDEALRERHHLTGGRVKRWIRFEDVEALDGAAAVALSGEALARRMRIGDEVRLLTRGGEKVHGEIANFDGDLIELDRRSFRLSDGDLQRIDLRIHDSLANGALIGAGIGGGLTALACAQYCEGAGAVVGGLILAGGFAGLGALLDSLSLSHRVIYSNPEPGTNWSVAPVVGRDRKGIFFSLRF
jgi:hypothetical protein